jgi:hypothetical protein
MHSPGLLSTSACTSKLSCSTHVLSRSCCMVATNKTTQKLQGFVNRCLRNILGIWWPRTITNQELWERTGQSDINVEIKRRKFGWIGHTLRKSQNEICHSVLEWNPQGKRSRGCSKATWRSWKKGKTSFGELRASSNNRVRWRIFVDGLCSWRNLADK